MIPPLLARPAPGPRQGCAADTLDASPALSSVASKPECQVLGKSSSSPTARARRFSGSLAAWTARCRTDAEDRGDTAMCAGLASPAIPPRLPPPRASRLSRLPPRVPSRVPLRVPSRAPHHRRACGPRLSRFVPGLLCLLPCIAPHLAFRRASFSAALVALSPCGSRLSHIRSACRRTCRACRLPLVVALASMIAARSDAACHRPISIPGSTQGGTPMARP